MSNGYKPLFSHYIYARKPLEVLLAQLSDFSGVSIADIVGGGGKMELVACRVVFAKIGVTHYGYTYLEVGRRLRKSHTTIFHYLNIYKPTGYFDNLYCDFLREYPSYRR